MKNTLKNNLYYNTRALKAKQYQICTKSSIYTSWSD